MCLERAKHTSSGMGLLLRCLNSLRVGSQHMEPNPPPRGWPTQGSSSPADSLRNCGSRAAPHKDWPEPTKSLLETMEPAACCHPK